MLMLRASGALASGSVSPRERLSCLMVPSCYCTATMQPLGNASEAAPGKAANVGEFLRNTTLILPDRLRPVWFSSRAHLPAVIERRGEFACTSLYDAALMGEL